jgi:serine/threonine protein kinase
MGSNAQMMRSPASRPPSSLRRSYDTRMPPTDDEASPALSATDPELSRTGVVTPEMRERHRDAPQPRALGYQLTESLGRGGMGEVLLARDLRIGRQVAFKRIRSSTPSKEAVERFLREAHVQARLDHPAIPPVYEIGNDEDGRPYFTMKRLSGVTLAETLASGASLQRLLRAFVEACFAVEYAHARGIVHRDLKPSNIMLGAFDEVYVLDWGVARVAPGSPATPEIQAIEPADATQDGAVLGTPGYLAPEQARGDDVGPAADVYALGCTLFEILTREPLHPRGANALVHLLEAPTESPAKRVPLGGIAPELDAICVAALAEDPHARPSARAVAEHIQHYLDGDRDLERRRVLATKYLAQANAALAAGDRAAAVRLAGRSLALDPESEESGALVSQLMLEPPRELPADLIEHLDEVQSQLARTQWKVSGIAFLTFVVFFPFLVVQGVTSWATVAAIYVLVAGLIGASFWNHRQRRPRATLALLLNFVLMILMERLTGPFILVPTLICIQILAWVAYPSLTQQTWRPIALLIAALAVPIALEALGVLRATWHVAGDAVITTSAALDLGGAPTVVILLASTLVSFVVAALYGRSLAVSRRIAQEQVEIQAWHLRHLLPRSLVPARST